MNPQDNGRGRSLGDGDRYKPDIEGSQSFEIETGHKALGGIYSR